MDQVCFRCGSTSIRSKNWATVEQSADKQLVLRFDETLFECVNNKDHTFAAGDAICERCFCFEKERRTLRHALTAQCDLCKRRYRNMGFRMEKQGRGCCSDCRSHGISGHYGSIVLDMEHAEWRSRRDWSHLQRLGLEDGSNVCDPCLVGLAQTGRLRRYKTGVEWAAKLAVTVSTVLPEYPIWHTVARRDEIARFVFLVLTPRLHQLRVLLPRGVLEIIAGYTLPNI